MYKINQFQPCLYALVLTGMLGYGLASGSMGMWVVGCIGVLINWWLNRRGRFRPLPRLVANLLTLVAMIYVGRELISAGNNAVLVIGQFLVVLQLVKLWEQRANRDYGQLLILSLLLMVAASINTGRLLFGLLFAVYLFLSLYCCLLFHLKIETDAARTASGAAEPKANDPDPVLAYANRQDERHLSRSMRRLTGLMSVVSVAAAVVVFLLFPRGAGQSMLVPMQLQQQAVLTGFSEDVKFDTVARITQNDEVIGYLELWKHGSTGDIKVTDGQEVLLRGVTLDAYHPNGAGGEWRRSASDDPAATFQPDEPWRLQPAKHVLPDDYWRQRIQLKPTGTRTLFALAGAFQLTPHRELRIHHGNDGALQSDESIGAQIDYEALSTGVLEDPTTAPPAIEHGVDPAIASYALRPEVSGVDANGRSLALLRRAQPAQPSPLDAAIAANIQRHLHGPEFSYTLDITDSKTRHEQDPYVWFLSPDGRRGHCEYFAGAMVLMCQSLGLEARMVVGFRCNDYTTLGDGYYIIRQSHAHAWVEVRTAEGWQKYDPTSGRETNQAARGKLAQWWQGLRHFFDFLEYTYAEKVVAYDNDNRENLIQAVEGRMTSTAMRSGSRLRQFEAWLNNLWSASSLSEYAERIGGPLASVLLLLAILAVAALTAHWAWQRIQLRRRAARIGIDSLPSAEQLQLARQLGFYDDLLRLLARRQLTRQPHQTPLEFSRSLLFLPSEAYETVHRLTSLYYRVRYGRATLSSGQLRLLANVIGRLDYGLTQAMPEGN